MANLKMGTRYIVTIIALSAVVLSAEADTSYSFGQGVYELKEGQVIDLVCKVVNPTTKPSIPILAWLPDHEHVANSSSLTVLFKTINVTTIHAILKFNPVSMSDIKKHTAIFCGKALFSSGASVSLSVLPKKNFAKVNLTSNGVSKYGAKNTFSCSGTAAIDANSKLLLKWWHYRKHAGNGSTIEMTDKATKPVVETVGSNNVIKSKLDVVVSGGTAGTYQCDVIVQWLNSYEYHFRQNASLLVPVHVLGGASTDQKVKVYLKKEVKLSCQAIGDPAAIVTWKKDKKAVKASSDGRISFSEYNTSVNGILTIRSAQFSDRAVYTCTAANNFSSVSMKFTLRVRDPLGALWPFLGIVIEAIILAVVIIVYERYKPVKGKKAKKKNISKNTNGSSRPDDNNTDRPFVSTTAVAPVKDETDQNIAAEMEKNGVNFDETNNITTNTVTEFTPEVTSGATGSLPDSRIDILTSVENLDQNNTDRSKDNELENMTDTATEEVGQPDTDMTTKL